MKKALLFPIGIILLIGFASCNGECVRCQKAGSQTLNYCENDFPSDIAYKNQIEALDSLGYSCTKK